MSKEQDIRMAAFDSGYKAGRKDALGEVEAKMHHMVEEAYKNGYEAAKRRAFLDKEWEDRVVNNPDLHRWANR